VPAAHAAAPDQGEFDALRHCSSRRPGVGRACSRFGMLG
jgi:hypothetical protein